MVFQFYDVTVTSLVAIMVFKIPSIDRVCASPPPVVQGSKKPGSNRVKTAEEAENEIA